MNTTIPTVTLANGVEMPQIGYGVYQISPIETEQRVIEALRAGYRMIDTAQVYKNEEGVGSGIAKSGLKREEVFLVSKIWISNYGDVRTTEALDESLRRINTDYVDLMLLHQPFCDRYGAWRALEKAYKAGKCRAIGVSNFFADHIVDLAVNNEIAPMVNQMETHVFQQRKTLRPFLDELNCRLMAWGPLAEGKNGFFTNPVLAEIGKAHDKSIAQIALRFLLEKGVIVIPKTTHTDRMRENLDILGFSLAADEIAAIEALDSDKSLFFDHHDGAVAKQFVTQWRGLAD